MILQSKRNVSSEGLTAERLYPVIAFNINLDNDINTCQILDDNRSLSWRQIDRFDVVSYAKEGYIKAGGDNSFLKYLYENLSDKDFFADYYLENEKSIIASEKLENALVSILSNELNSKELLSYIEIVGYKDENADLLLKSFFLKAKEKDIIIFANMLYDKIPMLNNYIIEIIIKNFSNYKTMEIESIFMELYINSSSYSEEIMKKVSSYLNI